MDDRLEEETLVIKALKGFGQSSTTSSNNEGPRTSASPEWHGEQPWNHRKRMPHTCISLADFESSNSWLGQESTKCSTKFEAIICVVLFLRFCQTFAKPLGCVFACVCALQTCPRVDAAANVAREPSIQVCLTTLGNLWLINKTASSVNLGSGELFGFNVGSYVEIPSGMMFANC